MKEPSTGCSLRLSVTDRCQFRCSYCLPRQGVHFLPRRELLSDVQLVACVTRLHEAVGLNKLRITGGEPLLRPRLPELIGAMASLGIPEIAMTTNGQLLAKHATELRRQGLQRLNVSLDSLQPEIFAKLSHGGSLAATLAGIDAALEAGLRPLKLNTVVMRGINDHEVPDLVDFAMGRGCTIRFLELMPIGPAAADFQTLFVPAAEVQSRLEACYTLSQLPYRAGGTSRDFQAVDGGGRTTTVGFISATSKPFCGGCRRLRLTATGELIGCLARSKGISLRPLLDAGAEPSAVAAAITDALAQKRHRPVFEQGHTMATMGG